jgi:hypothetical protein
MSVEFYYSCTECFFLLSVVVLNVIMLSVVLYYCHTKCHFDEFRCGEFHFAECGVLFIVILNVILLSVVSSLLLTLAFWEGVASVCLITIIKKKRTSYLLQLLPELFLNIFTLCGTITKFHFNFLCLFFRKLET